MTSFLPILGVLLSSSTLCASQTYNKFREKHIVNPGPINCADMIRQRAIKNPKGRCKRINTFIHKASPCTGGRPKCTYAQSMVRNAQICIACADNRHVHFSIEGPCDRWHGGTV
uniref:Ribonuclease A-domain domain-containing protein n=1 Tax=Leptobrachium leishanense TaxID=445787 RepID=A0A8C5Q2H6_9ANUR